MMYSWSWITFKDNDELPKACFDVCDASEMADDVEMVSCSQRVFFKYSECIHSGIKARPRDGAYTELLLIVDCRMKPVKYPQKAPTLERFKSFRDWPKYMHPTPEELTSAGFFYKGVSDVVTCFDCGIVLKNWKPDDNAAEEHCKFSPQCSYISKKEG